MFIKRKLLLSFIVSLIVSIPVFAQFQGYCLLKNVSSEMLLSVEGVRTFEGTNVYAKNESDPVNKIWWLTAVDENYYMIECYAMGKVLEVARGLSSENANVGIAIYNKSDEQLWQLVLQEDNTYSIVNKKTGKALTLSEKESTDGLNVFQQTYTSAHSQLWSIENTSAHIKPTNHVINLNDPHTEPMIPKWGFGFMQSAWGDDNGYNYQHTFLDHAKTLRGLDNPSYGKHKHPADVLVLDMYWCDLNWSWPGNMNWSYKRFPDPEALIEELHNLNFKIMLNYHEGGFGDKWLSKMQQHLDWGSDMVWLDFWGGGSSKEEKVWKMLGEHFGENNRLMFMARHYTRPNTDNHEGETEGKGIGYTKSPNENELEKSMPVHWTGDVEGSWLGFQQTIEGIVYAEDGAMGGWSYLHADCPGHKNGDNPELANRWIQFSDFSPITRNHGVGQRDVWSWGPKVEENSYHSRMLRYRLLPYIYTYSWEIWEKAIPLMRPFKLAYPGDRDDIRYEYMFGDELLVAPVHMPSYHYPNEVMSVYLPKGEQWVDYWSHEVYNGGATAQFDISEANNKYMPLYVKRGAIIPMGPEIFHIDPAEHPDPLTLDIYPLLIGKSTFTLHDDDGETKGYQNGEYAHTTFTCVKSADSVLVNIGKTIGDYTGKPQVQNYIMKLNLTPQTIVSLSNNGVAFTQTDNVNKLLEDSTQVNVWAKDEMNNILYARFQTAVDVENTLTIIFEPGELNEMYSIKSAWNDSYLFDDNGVLNYAKVVDSSYCWLFEKQSNGMYIIKNNKTGKSLSANVDNDSILLKSPNADDDKMQWKLKNIKGKIVLENKAIEGAYINIADSLDRVQSNAVNDSLKSTQWILEPFVMNVPVTGVSFGGSKLDLETSSYLSYTVMPADATNTKVIIRSLDGTIVQTDKNGYAHAIENGETKVVVSTQDGFFCDTMSVAVQLPIVPVDSVVLSLSEIEIAKGQSLINEYEVYPLNATNKQIAWESSRDSVVTVNDEGKINTRSEGEVYVIATSVDGAFQDSILVTVSPEIVKLNRVSIPESQLNLLLEETTTLSYQLTPGNTTEQSIEWRSSNENVAIVDQSGQVTAVGIGTASIILLSENKRQWDVVSISVSANNETGLERQSATVELYPIPVVDILSICAQDFDVSRIQIKNIAGVVVYDELQSNVYDLEIDLSRLDTGMYLMYLDNAAEKRSFKILKQ